MIGLGRLQEHLLSRHPQTEPRPRGSGSFNRLLIQRLADSRGSSLVEFSLVAFMLLMVIFGVVEISRLVLVYTDVANAAREGTRYGSTHASADMGNSSPLACNNVSGTDTIQGVACDMLTAAPVNRGRASVTVSGERAIGETKTITVTYRYDPLTTYFPLNVTLSSTSAGVIVFAPGS
jgi:Flp pilus assembly protein TadG